MIKSHSCNTREPKELSASQTTLAALVGEWQEEMASKGEEEEMGEDGDAGSTIVTPAKKEIGER